MNKQQNGGVRVFPRHPSARQGLALVAAVCACVVLGGLIVLRAQVPVPGGRTQLSGAGAPASQAAASVVGTATCLTCHSDLSESASQSSAHGHASDPRSPAGQQGCESCHGPGSQHVEAPDNPASIKRFAQMAPRDVSATCATCHNRGQHVWWPGSAHDGRNMSCTSCHSVHAPKAADGQLKAASVGESCATCHRPQAMKMQRSSHMPVREGKMTCATCHNPHGSSNVKLLRVGNWINESCVSCHAEKRGPFLFEHAPGRESCSTCHDPHGSNHERMLVAKAPMLCQRCHIGSRHPSTLYDNDDLRARSNRLVNRGCANCHQNIHGTNHPSGLTFAR